MFLKQGLGLGAAIRNQGQLMPERFEEMCKIGNY